MSLFGTVCNHSLQWALGSIGYKQSQPRVVDHHWEVFIVGNQRLEWVVITGKYVLQVITASSGWSPLGGSVFISVLTQCKQPSGSIIFSSSV